MTKKTGREIWIYLEDRYEGKANDAVRTNQEIILFNKCKLRGSTCCFESRSKGSHLYQHANQIIARNPRFDRWRGMVETGTSEVDTPDKLEVQTIRMDSYNMKA
ncbi:Hypothetical protein PHPALM_36463 [Phytophthora palmivora]|uniref:Uncharacterized protein n=1 Tax=Phytophthora palmivora TaxID=4796 RepID=A0A2P4WZW9_9STRA|nr:Hypothetical protein PHPALM_36463 [Phytophthora palmivora]